MKKILVISGSPRPTGNTYKIAKMIEEQMAGMGSVEFEYLTLKKINLQYCRGCLVCMKKGEEKCPCKDDSIMLRDKMLSTDGILFVSPVYVHTVSAIMKNFYDRFAYLCHQPRFRDKAAMFVVTTELTGGKETLEYMRFPAFTWGFKMGASLEVVYPGFLDGGRYREKILDQIAQAAKDFYSALTKPERKPLFRELMFFNLMKTKVTLHKDFLPADYNYWKGTGWLERNFYSEKSLPKFKSAIAKFLVRQKVKRMLDSKGINTTRQKDYAAEEIKQTTGL
jgi:multimeric flavodoxin WrbA